MDAILFWFLAVVCVVSGFAVILLANPIYSALCLAMTMIGMAGLFVTLNAYFLAGVQTIVYAGAVMVLFVMVLMLFDLKHETQSFTKGKFTGMVKLLSVGMIAGLVVGAIIVTTKLAAPPAEMSALATGADTTKDLGHLLFNRYVFGFEALGALLLVVAVGAVALARSKGGTHAKH